MRSEYPTNSELTAGGLTTYYAYLALGVALTFGAFVELRFIQVNSELNKIKKKLNEMSKDKPPEAQKAS